MNSTTTLVNPSHPNPTTSEELQANRIILEARFRAASDHFAKNSVQHEILNGTFGSASLSNTSSFAIGSTRAGDDATLQQVISKLIQFRDKRPVRILEVGAGVSYGDFQHRGAPWFSRALEKAFSGSVQVTLSDFAKNDLEILVVDPQGKLSHKCLSTSLPATHAPYSPFELEGRDGFKFLPTSWAVLKNEYPSIADRVRRDIAIEGGAHFLDREGTTSPLKVFLRPSIDSDFECAKFNLKFMSGVDFTQLEQHFAPDSFDVVFSRHLPPSIGPFSSSMEQKILNSTDKVLTQSGIACIHWD